MSESAELWLKSTDRPYGEGPGTPAICVKYARCPRCGAPAGELCEGSFGMTLTHHFDRHRTYTAMWKSGQAPPPQNSVGLRLKQLEARVLELEKQLNGKGRKR